MTTNSPTFEAFCVAEALRQRREYAEVPSSDPPSFSYYQWLEVAKEKYTEKHPQGTWTGEPAKKAVKVEPRSADAALSPLPTGNALADAIALQIVSSLEQQANLPAAPASLQRAAQEPFRAALTGPADLPGFLALAEATVRLTLWHPSDERISDLAGRLRPNLRNLEEEGILGAADGCYPALQLLVDLLSWRIICYRWKRLLPEMRQAAVKGVSTLCSCVRSPASDNLRAAVERLDVSSRSLSVPVGQLESLAAQLSAAIPFHFALCRDVTSLYPEPTGVLCLGEPTDSDSTSTSSVPSPPPSPAALAPAAALTAVKEGLSATTKAENTSVSFSSSIEDNLRLGDLLHAPAAVAITPTAEKTADKKEPPSAPPRKSALSLAAAHAIAVRAFPSNGSAPAAAPAVAVTAAAMPAAVGTRRMQLAPVNGHPACVSRYHRRYGDPSRHASSKCQYCATCHLMEILFGAERRDCTWGHWPTDRKIRFHLQRFPEVMQLAQRRFSEMKRGVQLAATDAVPL